MSTEKEVITAADVESVEVHAVAVMSSSRDTTKFGKLKAAAIEKAMSDAVLKANAEGLSTRDHSDEIKVRMHAARQQVLDEFARFQAEVARRLNERNAQAKDA